MYQEITQGGLNLIDSNPGTLTNYQPYDAGEPFEDRINIGSLNVKYHFDFADLTATSSYWDRDENLRQDGAEEIADVLGVSIYPSQGGTGPNSPTSVEDDKSRQWSGEVRLTWRYIHMFGISTCFVTPDLTATLTNGLTFAGGGKCAWKT